MRKIKTLTERHIEAFEFFVKLGPERTYKKVAAEFGVTTDTIQSWAAFGDWRKKIKDELSNDEDFFKGETRATITAIRKGAVRLTGVIQEWMLDLARIYQLALKETRELTPEETIRRKLLMEAIDMFNAKGMRDLSAFFRNNLSMPDENRDLDPKAPKGLAGPGVNAYGPTLIIYGGEKDGKKQIELQSGTAGRPGGEPPDGDTGGSIERPVDTPWA